MVRSEPLAKNAIGYISIHTKEEVSNEQYIDK